MEGLGPVGFGELLRQYRLAAAITQQQLAERARISVEAVSTLERGARRRPQRQTVDLLASALDLSRGQHDALLAAAGVGLARPRRRRAREVSRSKQNLPLQLTELIGRDGAVADVLRLLGTHRLVVVVGPGGVGKTRVTVRAGESLIGAFEDGVWFVDLAPLTNGEFVASAIALAIGLVLDGDDPLTALARLMKARRLLLVFDNCEHLTDEVARVAVLILRGCPGISILASSRHVLGIAGEVSYRLPPLPVPEAETEAAIPAQTALKYGAVELFAQRAAIVDLRFTFTDCNAPFVAEICRRLDGIPLAIELAAARVKVLAPERIAEKLGERFGLLTRAPREALPRQQTLRATMEWSHDLLHRNEKVLFARLSIFAGGWTLDAAESVCRDEATGADILDGLSSLVDKSLVNFDDRDSSRYRFLETTREYALEKLDAARERSILASKRAAWVASFADAAYDRSWTSPQTQWLARVLPEVDNVRAALQWALDSEGDLEIAGRIAAGLATLWRARRVGEGRRYIESILKRWVAGRAPNIEARLWVTLAALNVAKRKAEAADRAADLYKSTGDLRGMAESLRCRAEGLRNMQQIGPAERATADGLGLFRVLKLESGWHYAELLQTHATLLASAGRNDEARRCFEDVIRRLEVISDESSIAVTMMKLADLEFLSGNISRALGLAEEAAETCARLGDITKQAGVLVNIAAYHIVAGDLPEARAAAAEALELGLLTEAPFFVALGLQHLGTIAALLGDARRGAVLLSYADRWLKNEGMARESTERRAHELGMSAAAEALGSDLRELVTLGAALSEEEAIGEARQVR